MPEQKKITISIPIPSFSFKKSDKKELVIEKRSFLKRTVILVCISAFFLVLFYAFSILVKENVFNNFDFATTVRLQDNISARFDPYLSILSITGNIEVTSILLFSVLFITQAAKLTRLSHKGITPLQKLITFIKHPMAGLVVFFVFVGAHVIELIGKIFLDHPGPPYMFLRTVQHNFPQFYVSTTGSYPSGHSMRMTFLLIVFTFIVFSYKKLPTFLKAGIFLFLTGYSFAMLISRPLLGEHWTTDVVGGSLLGISAAFLALIFL